MVSRLHNVTHFEGERLSCQDWIEISWQTESEMKKKLNHTSNAEDINDLSTGDKFQQHALNQRSLLDKALL